MDALTPLAQRALEQIKATHTSVGYMALWANFTAEVQAAFVPIMDELSRAGYLTRTVYLVDRNRKSSWGDDYDHVALSDEEATEAVECQRERKPFVNPDTGDERVPGPEDLFISYCTTDKVPVLPPPPDPRAVELYERCTEKSTYFRKGAEQERSRARSPWNYDVGGMEGQAVAWEAAADLIAEAFGIKRPVAPPPAP